MSDVSDFILPSYVFYNLETKKKKKKVLIYDNRFDPTYLMYDAH